MKVFITRKIPDIAIKLLAKNGIDIIVNNNDKPVSRKDLIKYSADADGIISMLSDKFDLQMIKKLKKCRIIANYAVGFNNIDLEAVKEKNIVATNTPDILTNATAFL